MRITARARWGWLAKSSRAFSRFCTHMVLSCPSTSYMRSGGMFLTTCTRAPSACSRHVGCARRYSKTVRYLAQEISSVGHHGRLPHVLITTAHNIAQVDSAISAACIKQAHSERPQFATHTRGKKMRRGRTPFTISIELIELCVPLCPPPPRPRAPPSSPPPPPGCLSLSLPILSA